MMDHITTSYRTVSAERCSAPSFQFTETLTTLVGFLAAAFPFAAREEANSTFTVKTWTLTGGSAPPAPVPLRLT